MWTQHSGPHLITTSLELNKSAKNHDTLKQHILKYWSFNNPDWTSFGGQVNTTRKRSTINWIPSYVEIYATLRWTTASWNVISKTVNEFYFFPLYHRKQGLLNVSFTGRNVNIDSPEMQCGSVSCHRSLWNGAGLDFFFWNCWTNSVTSWERLLLKPFFFRWVYTIFGPPPAIVKYQNHSALLHMNALARHFSSGIFPILTCRAVGDVQ